MSNLNYQSKPPRIGVSILTLFWIVFPFNLRDSYAPALHRFTRINKLGLQLLPFWWLTEEDLGLMRALETPVISYEDRWNSRESFRQILVRGCCFWKPSWDSAALLGFFLFGTRKQSEKRMGWFREYFPDAYAIDVPVHQKYLMETSETNQIAINNHLADDGKICFDTWHFFQSLLPKTPLEKKFNQISMFLQKNGVCIEMIHVQTRNSLELWDFIHSRTTRLQSILLMLKPLVEKNNIPIIIELKPCSSAMLLATKNAIEDIFS